MTDILDTTVEKDEDHVETISLENSDDEIGEAKAYSLEENFSDINRADSTKKPLVIFDDNEELALTVSQDNAEDYNSSKDGKELDSDKKASNDKPSSSAANSNESPTYDEILDIEEDLTLPENMEFDPAENATASAESEISENLAYLLFEEANEPMCQEAIGF